MSNEQHENPAETGLTAPQDGALDLAETVEIERTGGTARAKVRHFPALTGWEIRRQYREFLESKEPTFRMAFTVTVLSHACILVQNGEGVDEVPLNDVDAVNALLENWQNVEKVFSAVLGYNGIKTDAAATERRRWQLAGEDLAAGFLGSVSSMIGPALTLAASNKTQD